MPSDVPPSSPIRRRPARRRASAPSRPCTPRSAARSLLAAHVLGAPRAVRRDRSGSWPSSRSSRPCTSAGTTSSTTSAGADRGAGARHRGRLLTGVRPRPGRTGGVSRSRAEPASAGHFTWRALAGAPIVAVLLLVAAVIACAEAGASVPRSRQRGGAVRRARRRRRRAARGHRRLRCARRSGPARAGRRARRMRAVRRERWTPRRAAAVAIALVSFYVTYLAYRNLKAIVPVPAARRPVRPRAGRRRPRHVPRPRPRGPAARPARDGRRRARAVDLLRLVHRLPAAVARPRARVLAPAAAQPVLRGGAVDQLGPRRGDATSSSRRSVRSTRSRSGSPSCRTPRRRDCSRCCSTTGRASSRTRRTGRRRRSPRSRRCTSR